MKDIYLDLLKDWCDTLLTMQINKPNDKRMHGGIFCPACMGFHGRSWDAVYPMMYLYQNTKDIKYLDGAKALFDWGENLQCDDGGFYNGTQNSWCATTVFAALALYESLTRHGSLLDYDVYEKWEKRLLICCQWIYSTITPDFVTNINYYSAAAAVMALAGDYFENNDYIERADQLGDFCTQHFDENHLFYGEGKPVDSITNKGCRPIDIGYNVEESLGMLLLYARKRRKQELENILKKSLYTHLEFMLPDGGWNNSFGTRNFKWTYWGSRTSDGCQQVYGTWGVEEPVFSEAALRNTELLKLCTHNGLLYGGPDYHEHGEYPCVHHTFSHAVALAAVLNYGIEQTERTRLPFELFQGVNYYKSLDTYQIRQGGFYATVTGYDFEYIKGGHASGGTLSMLWHEKTGPIIVSSMVDYSMPEPHNMQLSLRKGNHRSLTPRIEVTVKGERFSQCYDYQALLKSKKNRDGVEISVTSRLKNVEQNPLLEHADCCLEYVFTKDAVAICGKVDPDSGAVFILPIVGKENESYKRDKNKLMIDKKDIVNGIAGAIDWKEKGVEVVCFYNGKDALEHILEYPPDIVITDINMPFLSGLELVKEASAVHSDIRFIVLTGYDEFSYAREALHLGVVEYLSKPVRIEVIEELVIKEKMRLEELQQKKRDLVDIRIKFNQSLPYMKSRWFHSFISEKSNISETDLKEEFSEMEISLGTRYFTVVVIEHDIAFEEAKITENSENKLLLYAIENIAKELVGSYRPCEVFQCNENRLALLVNYDNDKNNIVNHYELYSLLTNLRKSFSEFFESTISIGMGECYEEIDGIIKSYEEAKEALSQKFYFGNNSIISIHDVSKEEKQNQIMYPKEMEDVIIRSIKRGNEDEALQNLDRYFDVLLGMKNAIPSKIREKMISFLLKIKNECSVEQTIHIMDLLDEFRQLITLIDMKEWFLSYAKYLCEKQDVNNTGIKKEILKVKEYIDIHYAEAITLKKMADYIFISQSYLSFTFKEIMKINFNEYLTKVRMERAKELLSSSSYKVYEVCELVGYSDKKYFSDLFKKHTGVLPSEWGRKDIEDGD